MNEKITDRKALADTIWSDYEKGLMYQKTIALKETCERNVDFVEGRQWARATERTKNFPRPVSNIIEFIVNNKKSNILSAKMKILYRPLIHSPEDADKAVEGADALTNFANNVSKEIDQETLDNQAIKDGLVKGMYAYHYFWDSEKKTGISRYTGGLNGQIVDALNIIFANPKEKDEQKQKWIMLVSRETLKNVKSIAKKYGATDAELELLTAEKDEEKNYQAEEQDTDSYVTVLTRYFRKNGEVYYIKSTKNLIIQPETALTPDASKIKLVIDEETGQISEDENELGETDEPTTISGYKMDLYPIAVGDYKERQGSIYGISEVEPLIAIQKAINFNYAMMLMSGQNIGFPKMVIRPKALQGQKVTNAPGELLVDYSPDFNGIKYLQPPSFGSSTMMLVDKLIEMTRVFTGATEIASGEVLGANMSGSAIVALQSQAKVPIEDMQKKFWRVHKKIAKIWEQFFKAYYTFDVDYMVENENGQEKSVRFNGLEYRDMEFDTTIDIGTGSAYSESMSIALLEASLSRGDITFDEFVELYPDNAMPFKARLKEIRKHKLLPPEISEQIASNPQILEYVMGIIQQANTPVQQQVNQSPMAQN